MNSIILVGNAILWLMTLIIYFKKYKCLDAPFITVLMYTTISIVGIHLYIQPYAEFYFLQELKPLPYIYLYLMIMLIVTPLMYVRQEKITRIKLPSKSFIEFVCIIVIICSIYRLFEVLPNILTGVFKLLTDSTYGQDAYSDTTAESLSSVSMSGSFDIISIIVNICINFSILLFFIYLLYPQKKALLVVGLTLSLLISPIESIASGSRQLVIVTLIQFVLLFFFFSPYISKRIIQTLRLVSLIIVCCLGVLFISISNSRNKGDDEYKIFEYERYIGESFIVFNNYCFDANGTREGNVVIPLINKFKGDKVYSQEDLRWKYRHLGIDNSRFYTFVGDFVLDFGPIVSLVIFLIISFFFRSRLKIKNRTLYVHQVILVFILLKILSGFYLHQFSGVSGNLFLIELLIVYFILYRFLRYFHPIIVPVNNKR